MGSPKVIYRDNTTLRTDSWGRYVAARILQRNENFLCIVRGGTGIGKSYTALSLCWEWGKRYYNDEFTIDYVVFSFLDLMRLINSGKVKRGSRILIEEPQVEINSKNFQSEVNKCFYQLASTFRHRGYIVFFCNPHLEDLDKSVRKLFHASFEVLGKDEKARTTVVKPLFLEWNAKLDDFYHHYLKVVFKPEGESKYISHKLKLIYIVHPPQSLADLYEKKKTEFTTALNLRIQKKLEQLHQKDLPKGEILGINIECTHCGHKWHTKSAYSLVNCPSCLKRVKNNNHAPAGINQSSASPKTAELLGDNLF